MVINSSSRGSSSYGSSQRPPQAGTVGATHSGGSRAGTSHVSNPLADPMLYVVVFLGGAIGTGLRYGLSQWMPGTAADAGPWSAIHPGTLATNLIACFVYAALGAALPNLPFLSARGRQLANRGFGMGMCGGLSTMSTLALEGFTSLYEGSAAQMVGAVLYLLVTFILGLAVAYAGVTVGGWFKGHDGTRGSEVEASRGVAHGDDGKEGAR